MTKRQKCALALIIGFTVVRSVLVWYGYDRLPYVSTTDETIFGDVAASVARGDGFVAKSIEGTLGLHKLFAYYPPVYPLVQALFFKLFGVSTMTLRGISVSCFVCYTMIFIIILYRLKEMKVIDYYSFVFVACLFLSDPTTYAFSRAGRPETLALLFSALGFLVPLTRTGLTESRRIWMLSALMIGLSISTHFEMVTSYTLYVILVAAHFHRNKRSVGLGVLLLPLCVCLCIWGIIYGRHSLEAFTQLRTAMATIHTCCPSYVRGFGPFIEALSLKSLKEMQQFGGLSLVLIWFSWSGIFLRALHMVRMRTLQMSPWRNGIIIFSVCGVINLIQITFIMGALTQRTITVLPIALVGFGIGISNIRRSYIGKYALSLLCVVLICVGIAGHSYHMLKTRKEWRLRDPRRFSDFVNSIPLNAKVLTVSPLWYELTRSGHLVSVIDVGLLQEDSKYLVERRPAYVNGFDVLILSPEMAGLCMKNLPGRSSGSLKIGDKVFFVSRKTV